MLRPHLLLLALLASGSAHAGMIVESVSSTNGPQTLSVAGEHVRVDPARAGAPGLLFDAERGRLVLLNRPARQYNGIDVDRLGTLEERVAEQRERMLEAIERAEEEEKERLERRLARLPRTDAAGAPRIETEGSGGRINGIDCERASVWQEEKRTHRLCIAPVAAIGLSDDSATTLRRFFDLLARMRNLLGSGPAPFDARLLQATLRKADAFPVRIERVEDGATWTVRRVDTAEIPEARFAIPADFTEGARLGGG